MNEVPQFCVKASDPFACAIIRSWITMASSYKRKDGSKPVPPDKIEQAEKVLAEFREYQKEHGVKVPD